MAFTKRNIIAFTFAVFFILPLSAQFNPQRVDSVRALIPSLEGAEKLDAYYTLSQLMIHSGDTAAHIQVMNDHLREAQAHNDPVLESKVRVENAIYYWTLYQDHDRFLEVYPAAMEFARRHNILNDYYRLFSTYIDLFLMKGNLDRALQEQMPMYEESKALNHPFGIAVTAENIARSYQMMRRYKDAEPFLREAITQYRSFNDTKNILDAYANLSVVLKAQNKFDEALAVLVEWEEYLEKMYQQGLHPKRWDRYHIDITYATIYTAQGNLDEAGRYFDEMESYAGELSSVEMEEFLYRRMFYFEEREAYQEGLAVADTLTRLHTKMGWQDGLRGLSVMNHRAWLLGYVGQGVEAVELYEVHKLKTDSLRLLSVNAQLDEIRTTYEVDKHIAEKERNRAYFLFAAAGCLLLLLLLFGWMYYSRRLAKKNRVLVRQIKEQDRLKEERKTENEGQETVEQETENVERKRATRKQIELFNRYHQYLAENDRFTQPEIEPASYLTELATNRTSLAEAVKAVEGVTPTDYIRIMKLNHGRLLLENFPDMTIEVIAEQCGFNTARTFYRLFRDYYTISPTEYRKTVQIL